MNIKTNYCITKHNTQCQLHHMQAVTYPHLLWFLVTLIVQSKFHQHMLRLNSTNQQAKCALLLYNKFSLSRVISPLWTLELHWAYTQLIWTGWTWCQGQNNCDLLYLYIYQLDSWTCTAQSCSESLLQRFDEAQARKVFLFAFSCPMMITGTVCIIETLQIVIKVPNNFDQCMSEYRVSVITVHVWISS